MAFRHEVLHVRRQKQRLIDIPGAKILAHSQRLNQTRLELNSDYSDRLLEHGITNRYCSPSFETATEPVIGRAFARPVGGLLRMRSSLLKHNNLMLRSERRERLEAWAASDSPISHSQYGCQKFRPRVRCPRQRPASD